MHSPKDAHEFNIRVSELVAEMDLIHLANVAFWKCGSVASLDARKDHSLRKERLEEIRIQISDCKPFSFLKYEC